MTTDISGAAAPGATRHDGWTLDRQLDFLEALADGCTVVRAAALVGMSAASAYRLRGRSEGDIFAHGWRAAQAMAYWRLREIAMERIERGTETPSKYKGEVVATKTVFSDRLLMSMLEHLKPASTPARGAKGVPRPAVDPTAAFAATVEAYEVAIRSGTAPVVPATACDEAATPAMTQPNYAAAIEAWRAANPRRGERPTAPSTKRYAARA